MKRLILLLVALCALCAMPASAMADGDPGSDVLYYTNLFSGAQDNLTAAQQVKLGHLLNATRALKAPVRVAIIGQRADLGFYKQLWGQPAAYAQLLGQELELAYAGRLVVVMPQGVAFYWSHHGVETLSSITSGTSASQLVAAATAAVEQVETSTGVSATALKATAAKNLTAAEVAAANSIPSAAIASAGPSTAEPKDRSSGGNVSPVIIVVGLLIVLGAVFWVPPVWRRRGLVKQGGIAVPGLLLGIVALAGLVVIAVVVHTSGTSTGINTAQATNPHLATVDPLEPQRAPNFTLTDETGHKISLKQYRGKVVILSFTDDECQTICPLTTQAMVDARDSLGAARKDVQLLGVDANGKSTSVDDVLSYTQLHGMLGQWHFLTGSDGQLQKVWDEYGISDDLSSSSTIIDHTPAVWIIGPNGKARATSLTYASYSAIPQFGQELAQAVSGILPSHPKVQTNYSYDTVKGILPTAKTTLQKVGGGTVTLGTGKPHLYLFFATWDQQSTAIGAQMEKLNAYAKAAKKLGLPPITAIDEESVEPNPTAVTEFLSTLHLDYPVAIDRTGQVADGYGVQGEPWFVLAVPDAKNSTADPTASTPFTQEVYTEGWPTLAQLEKNIPVALKPAPLNATSAQVAKQLAGSPPALASLHRQASRLLPGGAAALKKRLAALKGEPVVVNIWASNCGPCQAESQYFAAESAVFGSKVAFLGIDYNDRSTFARGFLSRRHVYYPSYAVGDAGVPGSLLPGGVQSTPTTIFLNAKGVEIKYHPGAYPSAAQLGSDIESYALGNSS